jgi:DHA1 family tetracycline resistance protein-like MFS transporter
MMIYFLGIVAFSIMTASFSLFMMFRLGYDAFHNGWIFAFVGVISAVVQGGLIGRLVKKFGESLLVIAGALLFALSLMLVPFLTPQSGIGIILLIAAATSIGQALSAPTLSSLASKSASAAQQGSVLGVMQSVASLARAVGPSLAALLIYSAVAHVGFDGVPQKMSDASLRRTFWTAAGIQFAGFLLALYFWRAYADRFKSSEAVETGASN